MDKYSSVQGHEGQLEAKLIEERGLGRVAGPYLPLVEVDCP